MYEDVQNIIEDYFIFNSYLMCMLNDFKNWSISEYQHELVGEGGFDIQYYQDDQIPCLGYMWGMSVQNEESVTIEISPNPASKELNISLRNPNQAGAVIRMIDMFGNEVLRGKLFGESKQFDISGISSGVYLVSVENSKPIKLIIAD